MIKNETYKGLTNFLVELRKHLSAGTAGNFWRETTGKTAWPIAYSFKDTEFPTLLEFVNWFIKNHEDVSDEEFNSILMELPNVHWILQRRAYFILEVAVKPSEQSTPEPEQAVAEEDKTPPDVSESVLDGVVDTPDETLPETPVVEPAKKGRKPSKKKE